MIHIENLSKNYGAFHLEISMDLQKGCITGLVGRNGMGKTTTLKAILGLIRPDSGQVLVFGKAPSELTPAEKERIGAALSDSGFSSYLTVEDAAAILEKMYRRFDRKHFLQQCRRYGIPAEKQIRNYSTGMKAKLRVLTALCHDADLLILDEPTVGLDVEARNEILDILRGYLVEKEERCILITSHIATDLEGLCDDIYMIHDGRILLHEDTDVILSQYAVIKTDEAGFAALDRAHILAVKKECYGYACLTDEKTYYLENYPGLVIEKSGIDDLILIMNGGR